MSSTDPPQGHDPQDPSVFQAHALGSAAPRFNPPPNRQGSSFLFRMLSWLCVVAGILAIFFIGSFFFLGALFSPSYSQSGQIDERYHSLNEWANDDKVAIIKITGAIMQGDGGFVKNQIDQIHKDENVKAVVVRIDSPGGTVSASDYLYHHLSELRLERNLPMVVSMGGMAASGGYYVAMAVGQEPDVIFAEQTTTTGSIGVIVPHYDLSGLLENWNVKDDSIASHPRKQMLSMTRTMSEDDRRLLKEYVDESFRRFKEVVQSGRTKFAENLDALNELATGEIFTAAKAKEKGLVDHLGFIESAIDRAIELAKLEKDNTKAVYYSQRTSLFDLAMVHTRSQQRSDLDTLIELSIPKAYFLMTSLPPLMTSHVLK